MGLRCFNGFSHSRWMQEIWGHTAQKNSPLCHLFAFFYSKRSTGCSTLGSVQSTAVPTEHQLHGLPGTWGMKHPFGILRTSHVPREVLDVQVLMFSWAGLEKCTSLELWWQFCQSELKQIWVHTSQKQWSFSTQVSLHFSRSLNETIHTFTS